MIKMIILLSEINKEYKIKKIVKIKPTARVALKFIAENAGEQYLISIASSEVQKFYLNREILMQKKMSAAYSDYFKFNFPVRIIKKYGMICAIYKYITDLKDCKDDRPLQYLEIINSKYYKMITISKQSVEFIKYHFLESIPKRYRRMIIKTSEYDDYFNNLQEGTSVKLVMEHGDFTRGNIKQKGEELWLFDFEFAKENQIVGMDSMDFLETYDLTSESGENLNNLKIKLCWKSNFLLDKIRNYKWFRGIQNKVMRVIIVLIRIKNRYRHDKS